MRSCTRTIRRVMRPTLRAGGAGFAATGNCCRGCCRGYAARTDRANPTRYHGCRSGRSSTTCAAVWHRLHWCCCSRSAGVRWTRQRRGRCRYSRCCWFRPWRHSRLSCCASPMNCHCAPTSAALRVRCRVIQPGLDCILRVYPTKPGIRSMRSYAPCGGCWSRAVAFCSGIHPAKWSASNALASLRRCAQCGSHRRSRSRSPRGSRMPTRAHWRSLHRSLSCGCSHRH